MRNIGLSKIVNKLTKGAILGIVLLCGLFPLIWVFFLSIKTPVQAFHEPPLWIFKPTFESYLNLIEEGAFFKAILNSSIVSSGSIGFALAIGAPAAYSLSRCRLFFKNSLLTAILASRMIPGLSFIIPFAWVYAQIHLINTFIGLILVQQVLVLSLATYLMYGYFEQVPRELEEAARIDGANILQCFTKIALPLSAPGLIAATVLSFAFSWNEFMFAVILTRKETRTAPVAISTFIGYGGVDWGRLASATMLYILPTIIFAFFMQKYFVRGIFGGALKG